MMILQRIQTVATSVTMIGVWSNLYLTYKREKRDIKLKEKED
jgi:hypothetical protein